MKKIMTAIISIIVGMGFGITICITLKMKHFSVILEEKSEQADKYNELFQLMNQWINIKQKGKSLVDYFEKRKYKNIAIYGMNFAGETLVNELKGSPIIIKYGIDRDAKYIIEDFHMITPDGMYENVDAVVVTSVYYFAEIADMLEKKIACPIISLEDIIYEIL